MKERVLSLSIVIVLLLSLSVKASVPNLHIVEPGLYRSGLLEASNLDELKPLGIKTIISMKTEKADVEVERSWSNRNGVSFINVPINMLWYTESTKDLFWIVHFSMKELRRPILIHCSRGADRTGIAVAMWRILNSKWDVERAITEMDYYGYNPMLFFWKRFLRGDVWMKNQ